MKFLLTFFSENLLLSARFMTCKCFSLPLISNRNSYHMVNCQLSFFLNLRYLKCCNSMPMVSISYSYHTLMYKEQRFIKNVYGTRFDISEIILRVKSSYVRKMFMSTVKKRAEKK